MADETEPPNSTGDEGRRPDPDGPGRRLPWFDRLQNGLLSFAGRRFYGQLPAFVHKPFDVLIAWLYRLSSVHHEKSRPLNDGNYNIVIPTDERISVPYVWVVEMFPPSYADGMFRSIRRAGWTQDSPLLGTNVENIIRRARQSGNLGSRSIAKLVDPAEMDQSSRRIFGYKAERLPPMFKSIDVTLVELGSSLTALVAGFELKQHDSLRLDRALRAVREPVVTNLGRGAHSVRSRLDESNRWVERERAAIHDQARGWFVRRMPGVFAAESRGKQLPTMDLIITEIAKPFVTTFRDGGNYLPALGLSPGLFRTTAPELPGISFTQYSPGHQSDPNREYDLYSLSGCLLDIPNNDDATSGGEPPSIRIIANEVNELVPRFLARLGITALLGLKSRSSAASRDLAHDLHSRHAVRSTKKLRESFLRGSLDTLSIASGVRLITTFPNDYKWNVMEFFTERNLIPTLESVSQHVEPESQLSSMLLYQRQQAKSLLRDDAETRQILGVVASLTGSIEGMRVQRWALWISLLSLVTALIAIAISIAAADGGSAHMDVVRSIFSGLRIFWRNVIQ
ncbi:hypothetical protein QO003_000745 [Arthrobacter silviterrae]|uniref:Uncharacterized protein n=1 Tax=Arthrobacter silviterrae TaxID=2026658 RepID=A0ABX0DG14_9MICC|nr:hypothetical protein [Arthrobacter silviterrae]MDQ0276442.1 hypothetical protein [Arthrobacter silviterrae]NGN84720.1 hypothetical protein [Arthrobacter silviterrae]